MKTKCKKILNLIRCCRRIPINKNFRIQSSEYTEFKNLKEADTWGKNQYADWAKQYKAITREFKIDRKLRCDIDPIGCYLGNLYKQINEELRKTSDKTQWSEYIDIADVISVWIAIAPRLDNNIIVYRVVEQSFINNLFSYFKNHGKVPYLEKGFLSCSLTNNIAFDYMFDNEEKYLLKIHLPKGIKSIYASLIQDREEYELLIDRNYYIEFIRRPYNDKKINMIVLECRVINRAI